MGQTSVRKSEKIGGKWGKGETFPHTGKLVVSLVIRTDTWGREETTPYGNIKIAGLP